MQPIDELGGVGDALQLHAMSQAEPVLARPEQAASATVERLEKLAALRASGALDEEEFQRLKADALKKV